VGLVFALLLIAVPAAALVYDFWKGGENTMLKPQGRRIKGSQGKTLSDRLNVPSLPARGRVRMVTKPDWVARSTAGLLAIEADLSKRDVGLIVLSMGGERRDTSKLMLTILTGVAIWEGEIMLERRREGIAKAKAEGKFKGRPAHIDAAEIKRLSVDLGPAAIAKPLGVARSTVYRLLGPVMPLGSTKRHGCARCGA
jgi:hypothetical protein